ncbi:MAG: hypothetical protein A2420_00800 [Candidatus Moranbacteria bacterium RIFOXYC1_FULL_44_13]|nr:MAG: hypothetical protein A2184_03925 [Candidatus Moranbacteria bacterium RIFOXYA1_FULL_44_7]OGI32680.1 MAG: hypothetical protein A2420_00800 [Candidatus Moranbacteria bacterium RIFOXYC1_FULL_44_13]OGI37103.1 MAG: hypothetical protein A2612_04720 [Candidatus Moranbacteria bacterium RIFOXYD1_FULL_44_12]
MFQHTREENIAWWSSHLAWLKKRLDEVVITDFDKRQSITEKGGRPYKNSPQELAEKGLAYFKTVIMAGMSPSISGLCLNLDMSRRGLLNLEKGRPDGKGATHYEFSEVVRALKMFVEEYYESQAHEAENPYFYIFALKQFGWKG